MQRTASDTITMIVGHHIQRPQQLNHGKKHREPQPTTADDANGHHLIDSLLSGCPAHRLPAVALQTSTPDRGGSLLPPQTQFVTSNKATGKQRFSGRGHYGYGYGYHSAFPVVRPEKAKPGKPSQAFLPSLQTTQDKLQADHHRHAKNLLRVTLKAAQFASRLTKGLNGKCDDDEGLDDDVGKNAKSQTGNQIMDQSGAAPDMKPIAEPGTKPKKWVKKMSDVWAFLALKHRSNSQEEKDNTGTSLHNADSLPQAAAKTSSPGASSMSAIDNNDRKNTDVENGSNGHGETKGNITSRNANDGLERSPEAQDNNMSGREGMQMDTNLKEGPTAKGKSGSQGVSSHEKDIQACSSEKLYKKDNSSKDYENDKTGTDSNQKNSFGQHVHQGSKNQHASGSLPPKEDGQRRLGDTIPFDDGLVFDQDDENPFDDGFDQDDDANLLAIFEFFARHKDYKGRNVMAPSEWRKFWDGFDEEFPGISPSIKNLNQIFQKNLDLQIEMNVLHDMRKGGASRGLNFVSFKAALHQAVGDYQNLNVDNKQGWKDVMHYQGRGRG